MRVDDPRLRPLLRPEAELVELVAGLLWAEELAWVPSLGRVLSDVRADRELLWQDGLGLSVRRQPATATATPPTVRGAWWPERADAVGWTRTNPDGGG